VPVTYTSDAQSLDVIPSARLAATHGVTQLLTDYQYLDADWQFGSDRNTYSLGGAWHRDSTFYNVFERAELRGRTLPRLEEDISASWRRALSERSGLQLAASYDQVAYSAESSLRLDNYNYLQGSLKLDRTLNERWSADASIGYGRYALQQQTNGNETRYLQTSTKYQVSDHWTLAAQLGYSRLASHTEALLCCVIVGLPGGRVGLGYIRAKQSSAGGIISYGLTVEHQSEQVSMELSASRTVQPTSFGALLTLQTVRLSASRPVTDRWTLNASLQDARQSDTLAQRGSPVGARFESAGLGASWQWTEHWTLGIQCAYSTDRVGGSDAQGKNGSVLLSLTRQLGRVRL
jgi:hypothetical protein